MLDAGGLSYFSAGIEVNIVIYLSSRNELIHTRRIYKCLRSHQCIAVYYSEQLGEIKKFPDVLFLLSNRVSVLADQTIRPHNLTEKSAENAKKSGSQIDPKKREKAIHFSESTFSLPDAEKQYIQYSSIYQFVQRHLHEYCV